MQRLFLFLLLSCLPLLARAADVTGLWVGYYAYDPAAGGGRVECAFVLQQINTGVGGTMIERQTFGDEIFPGLPSDVTGALDGNTLTLGKVYLHEFLDAGNGASARRYQLTISPDGNELSGFWTVGEMQGNLYFRRVTAESATRIPKPN